MGAMDVGVYLNPQAPVDESPAKLADGLVEQTRLARGNGFDVISTGQHYLADYNQLQLLPLLSRLSAESGDMKIATGIILLPLHHPIAVAEQITTLECFAEDVIVGVGAGYRDVEFENFSVRKWRTRRSAAGGRQAHDPSLDGEGRDIPRGTTTRRPMRRFDRVRTKSPACGWPQTRDRPSNARPESETPGS